MLLVDDLVLAPGKFVLWIIRQVHEAAREELSGERQRVTAELGRLHGLLESGRISEAQFDLRERELLDRLDALEEQLAGTEQGADARA